MFSAIPMAATVVIAFPSCPLGSTTLTGLSAPKSPVHGCGSTSKTPVQVVSPMTRTAEMMRLLEVSACAGSAIRAHRTTAKSEAPCRRSDDGQAVRMMAGVCPFRPRSATLDCGDSYAAFPVVRAAVQVHHRFDVNGVGTHAVNDGVGKAVEVELAIVAPDFAPAFRLGHDAAQGAFKLVQEGVAQARLPFL